MELFEPELLDLHGLNFDRNNREAELVFSFVLPDCFAAAASALSLDSSFCLSYSADALNRLHLINLLIFLNFPKRFSNKLVNVLVSFGAMACTMSNFEGRVHGGGIADAAALGAGDGVCRDSVE